jgi:hypothetical protein
LLQQGGGRDDGRGVPQVWDQRRQVLQGADQARRSQCLRSQRLAILRWSQGCGPNLNR